MKTDIYTKIILTVIAVILSINLFKGTITPAMADNRHYVSLPLNADGSLNVIIKKGSEPMKVSINEVDKYAFQFVEPIKVKVKE